MSEKLTIDDLVILRDSFAPADVEFLFGNAYIQEHAVSDRIETVDPAWSFDIRSVVNRDGTIHVVGALSIKGSTRVGLGMESVLMTKDGKAEANKAEKSAATDALKRAARLFGIGRYLLSLPKNIKDEQGYEIWFNGESTKGQPDNGSHATKDDISTPDVGYQEATIQLFTSETKDGKKTKFFEFGDGDSATLWTREPFRILGFDEKFINDISNVGEHIIPASVIPKWQKKGVYRQVVALKLAVSGVAVILENNKWNLYEPKGE